MSRWLLILGWTLSLTLTVSGRAEYELSSRGSTSDQEASLIWGKATEALEKSKPNEAIPYLERLVDRYPGFTEYVRAHFLLGQALMELKRYRDAEKPLKFFIQAPPIPTGEQTQTEAAKTAIPLSGIHARVLLSEVFLKTGRPKEAHLLVTEIRNIWDQKNLPPDLTIQILVLNTQSLVALHREKEAQIQMEAALRSLKNTKDQNLQGKAFNQELELKLLNCSHFSDPKTWRPLMRPSKIAVQEGQIQDQFKRRGTCLLEAFLVFEKTLKLENEDLTRESAEKLSAAYQSYRSAARSPVFQIEMRDLMLRKYKSSTLEAQDLLTSFKQSLSPKMQAVVADLKHQLAETIKGIE